jgi:hypothetical protein
MIQQIEELIIYTTDSGSKSVYLRANNNDFIEANNQTSLKRWMKWKDILSTAENNESLETAIQQVEVIYELIRKHNN